MSPEEKSEYYKEVSKHNAANTSEWIGAIFRYGLGFGKRKFNTLYTAQEYRKNAVIGNLLQIVIIIAVIVLGLLIFS